MEIRFCPTETRSGVVSFITWQNPDLHAALRIAFNEAETRENLVAVEVTREGLKAFFEPRKNISQESKR